MASPDMFLQGPIPGQSLTDTPRKHPWERPPEMSDIEDITKYYINKLADQDVLDDLAVLIDGGLPIRALVETMTTTAVSAGKHSLDASLIVGPVIHAFIKSAMTQYGIDVKDEAYNPKKDPVEKERKRVQTAIRLALAEAGKENRTAESDPGVAILQEMQDMPAPSEDTAAVVEGDVEQPAEVPVEASALGKGKGLMARGEV